MPEGIASLRSRWLSFGWIHCGVFEVLPTWRYLRIVREQFLPQVRRLAPIVLELGQYLHALGHSAAIAYGVDTLRLDQGKYEPYLGHRRLRALGSGSDPARLVGAYSLALAGASATLNGLTTVRLTIHGRAATDCSSMA